eukprot:PhM_4_TR3678/c0_g1_i1/m.20184
MRRTSSSSSGGARRPSAGQNPLVTRTSSSSRAPATRFQVVDRGGVGNQRRYGDIEDSDYVHDEIKELAQKTRQAIVQQRQMDEAAILHGLRQFGPSEGAKKMMVLEKEAADNALMTGLYVVFRNMNNGKDCCRVGPSHKCFCTHTLADHDTRNRRAPCRACGCTLFSYIPNRPEEIGENWLPRRQGFDITTWAAKCRCGHGHDAHAPGGSHSCRACRCMAFDSHFLCVVCDKHWEEHETVFESEAERVAAGRPVGDAFQPLSDVDPEYSEIVFGSGPPRIVGPPGVPQRRINFKNPPPAPKTRSRCTGCRFIFQGSACPRCGVKVPN